MSNKNPRFSCLVEKVSSPGSKILPAGTTLLSRNVTKDNCRKDLATVLLPEDKLVYPSKKTLLPFGAFNLNQDTTFVVASPEHPITIPKGTRVKMDDGKIFLCQTTLVYGRQMLVQGHPIRFDSAPAKAPPNIEFIFANQLTIVNQSGESSNPEDNSSILESLVAKDVAVVCPSGKPIPAKAA